MTLTAYSADGAKGDTVITNVKVDNPDPNLTIQVNGVLFKMIYVEGSTFWMGAQSTTLMDRITILKHIMIGKVPFIK